MTLIPHQRQRCAQTERGNGSLGLSAHICVAGNDPQYNWSGNRAGFFGFAPSQTRRAISRASHYRSVRTFLLPVLDRGRMLIPSWASGLHSPAERIGAARGAFHSVRVLGSTPSRAQSLANQHLHKLAVAKINHLNNALSSSAVSVGIDPNENGLTHEARSLSPDDKIHD